MARPIAAKFLAVAKELKSDQPRPAENAPKPDGEKPAGSVLPNPPTIAQVADKIVARLDKDGDQSVSTTEMTSLLNPQGRFKVIDKMLGNLITRVDGNQDGLVGKAEWVAALNGLDKNADGMLSRGDLHHGPDALIALIGVLPHHPTEPLPPAG